ncbi:MAG: redox-regulated molecular chaperone Hsp33 [Gammaproteobacteria bacterium]|nr:redox-regulated molecular chaperone Hsp33 [Gammaproteobacteria bacterium]
MPDLIQNFLFDALPVRGSIINLEETFQTILTQRAYPALIQELLGEALISVVFLNSMTKHKGHILLQFQGDGPLKLISVRCTHDYQLRALVQWNGILTDKESISGALGQGTLSVMCQAGVGESFQSIVPLVGKGVASSMEAFFQQSVQLETRFWMATSGVRAAGLVLQRMPSEDQNAEEAWSHVGHLANTIKKQELLTLPATEILHRLFHQEDFRVFPANPVYFGCGCSIARMEGAVLSMGEEEAAKILEQSAFIEVKCAFCGNEYQFDMDEVAQIFQKPEDSSAV